MWVTKLLISQVKKKDFLPQNDQIWPKIGIFGQFGPGHAGLFNALLWVGWWLWRAGCISQDTYLLYVTYTYRPDICHEYHELYSWRKNCHVEKFQLSMYDNCGEIENFSTCGEISDVST